MSEVKGYKGFDKDLKCMDFQYDVGKTYILDGELELCKNGFHFCKEIKDVYEYYLYSSRICEVTALGDVIEKDDKLCTNIIRIDKEITDPDIICCNSGNGNFGYFNEGDHNIGNKNVGFYNKGINNVGDYNFGNNNKGSDNKGNNNSGYFNKGDYNVGDFNIGNKNVGDFNVGNNNVGDFNIGVSNKGVFNTNCNNDDQFYMFNKPSDWDIDKWRNSEACRILKSSLIMRPLNDKYMDIIRQLPNFDESIFELIKKITIDECK